MNEQQWIAMDEYLCDRTQTPDEALDAALQVQHRMRDCPRSTSRRIRASCCRCWRSLRGARRILELGTLGGYSTIWLARALPADGTLLTLEAVEHHADVARKNIERAGLSGVVSIFVGDAAETLEGFVRDGIPPFDFIFLDADKTELSHVSATRVCV